MINKTLSKDYQVMATVDNMNETDVKQRKVEEVNQNTSSSGNQSFMMFCKENGTKILQDEYSFNDCGKQLLNI